MQGPLANPASLSGDGGDATRHGGQTIHILHHTFRRCGGMECYGLLLSEALRSLGCRVVFHASQADVALARAMGVELDLVPVAASPRKLQDFRFFRRLEERRKRFDGVQIALSRVRAADVVICGGTQRGYLRHTRKSTGPFDLLQLWMERQAYNTARTVVSHSDLCAGELEGFYRLPPEKILTLRPPLEARFAPPLTPEQRVVHRRRFGFPEDKVVLLFPSMGHSRKGFKPVCHALEEFSSQVILAVAGKPAGATRPFVKSLGYIEDMAPLYQAADFTILGSYYEPFGMVGPESVLCGTRLIFEENVGSLDAIDPAQVLRFSVWEPASVRSAISRAIELARGGEHRIGSPREKLLYDPSPRVHAEALLHIARREHKTEIPARS